MITALDFHKDVPRSNPVVISNWICGRLLCFVLISLKLIPVLTGVCSLSLALCHVLCHMVQKGCPYCANFSIVDRNSVQSGPINPCCVAFNIERKVKKRYDRLLLANLAKKLSWVESATRRASEVLQQFAQCIGDGPSSLLNFYSESWLEWEKESHAIKGCCLPSNSSDFTAALVTTLKLKQTPNLWTLFSRKCFSRNRSLTHNTQILTTSLLLGVMFWEKPSLAAQAAAT